MEFVSYIETRKGKKLLKVFKSKRAVDMFLKKNTDKILSKSGIESVGSMSKRDWDSKEAKYAVNEAKYKVGDTITVIRKDGMKYKGKVEKLNPLKLRTDSTSTVVLPNPMIKKVVKESINETKYKVGDTLSEGLISPKSGHEYFQLTKNTPVKYIAGHSGLGLTNPGVLLKNIPGFIDGKKGAYLIDYHGALFYVDLKKKVAVRLGYDLSKQPKLRYKTNFKEVPQAPEFSDWKKYLKESEDGVPQGYNPMVESKTKESKVIQKIHTYTKTEKKFYDELAKHEVRIGQRDYAKFIINALRGFSINPREFKRIPDAEEKLYQVVSKND